MYSDRPFPRTPLMTYLLSWLELSDLSSLDGVLKARRFIWFLSTLIALATLGIAYRLCGPLWTLPTLTLLLSYSTFLERGLRIRADVFATLFALVALGTVCAPKMRKGALFFSGVALGLSFISSQKAIYFVAAFAAALIARHLSCSFRTAWKRVLVDGSVSSFGFSLPLLILSAWYWRQGDLQTFIDQTVVSGAHVGLFSDVYEDTWRFLGQTIRRNSALWIFAGLGIVELLRSVRRQDGSKPELRGPRIALVAFALVQVAAYLQHTVKFPYIFINISPTLALVAVFGLQGVVRAVGDRSAQSTRRLVGGALGIGLAMIVLIGGVVHHVRHFSRTSLRNRQEQTMNFVDELTVPTDAIFDGVGMAVSRRKATPYSMTVRWFAESIDHQLILAEVEASAPPIMILNYRVRKLPSQTKKWFVSHYLQWEGKIWVAGMLVDHESDEEAISRYEVDLPAATRYLVPLIEQTRVWVDGKAMIEGGLFLSEGPHSLEVSGPSGPILLIHAGAWELGSPETMGDSGKLFEKTYSD